MTRVEHITNIIEEIILEAGITVIPQYTETNEVAKEKAAYTFVVSESEATQFEDQRTFQMTTLLMTYIDFQIDDYSENYTTLRNAILDSVETARVTADLTLDRNEANFIFNSQVPMIRNIAGVFDTQNRKGIIDILWEVKTISIPV